jgi:hypothetical protein
MSSSPTRMGPGGCGPRSLSCATFGRLEKPTLKPSAYRCLHFVSAGCRGDGESESLVRKVRSMRLWRAVNGRRDFKSFGLNTLLSDVPIDWYQQGIGQSVG